MIPILSGNVASALGSGFDVDNSGRFNRADSAFLSRSASSTSNRRTFTFSAWIKRSRISNADATQMLFGTQTDSSNRFDIGLHNANNLVVKEKLSGTTNIDFTTSRLLRDPTAWYHIIIAIDTTQSTESNRVKIYVNGSQETSFADSNYPDEDYDTLVNVSGRTYTVAQEGGNNYYFGGYMAEVCLIDGSQLAPTSFGEFSEDSPTIWMPKDVSGLTFGTNGFYLDFQNSAELGTDVSGNSNTFTENNLAAADQATDTPTNSFATLNPLWRSNYDNDGLFSEGNCKLTFTAANSDRGYGFSTMGVTAGKWYWEVKVLEVTRASTGVGDANAIAGFSNPFYDETPSKGMQVGTSGTINENDTSTSYASALSNNDIIMYALDMDNHRCWYGINGTWQDSGDPTSGATGTGDMTTKISDQTHINTGEFILPFVFDASTTGQASFECNFGGCSGFDVSSGNADGNGYGDFEYAPPSGFLSLCTKNLGSDGG